MNAKYLCQRYVYCCYPSKMFIYYIFYDICIKKQVFPDFSIVTEKVQCVLLVRRQNNILYSNKEEVKNKGKRRFCAQSLCYTNPLLCPAFACQSILTGFVTSFPMIKETVARVLFRCQDCHLQSYSMQGLCYDLRQELPLIQN